MVGDSEHRQLFQGILCSREERNGVVAGREYGIKGGFYERNNIYMLMDKANRDVGKKGNLTKMKSRGQEEELSLSTHH